MQDSNQRQLSNLVSNRLPEFVRVDHPTLVAFLEAYYEWLQLSDRGGKLLSPVALGDVIDVDDTLDEFVAQFKKEYLLNFPEQLAISKATGQPVDARKLIKNIKAFYRAKGTEKSYEFLFRILYDVDVEFYYPKKDILRVSDGKWYEKNSLKVTNRLGSRIFDVVGRIVYQRNAAGQISASAKVTDVSVYQEGLYEVAELSIVGRNGTFLSERFISFDVDSETFTELKIYSVVSSITVGNAGSGYAVGDKVVVTPASGDSGINATGVVALVNSTGGIRKIRIDSFGINYTKVPTVAVQSLGGSGFSGTATIGPVCQSDGYYLNYDGRISTDKVLQDNHYYQEYSYTLKTEVVIDKYRETIRRLVHPAGTAMFGQVMIKRCSYGEIDNSSALIRYEVPVIGHYAPYTFQTYDNLQDWFVYFDALTNGLTAAGYDPNRHNELISDCEIPGNPISSGVDFNQSQGGFLGVPRDSIPDFSIPLSGIPQVSGVLNIGPLSPLGEPGFKNSDPFWFIYQHPNRRINEPTIAQIWKNQIVDGLTFDWQWPEHCSVTGGKPPSGWTADFYGDNPVDKKYTFLQYDGSSAFRKITARSFFEIPIGKPFDCRSVDLGSVTLPEIAISYPRNGEILKAYENDAFDDYTNLTVSLAYTNFENNDDPRIPTNSKITALKVTVNGIAKQTIDLSGYSSPGTTFSVNSSSMYTGLTRNTVSVTPLNLGGRIADGYSSSEVGFLVFKDMVIPTITVLNPRDDEGSTNGNGDIVVQLEYGNYNYNRFLGIADKVDRIQLTLVGEGDAFYQNDYMFGTNLITIPVSEISAQGYYTLTIVPLNAQGEPSGKVLAPASVYFPY